MAINPAGQLNQLPAELWVCQILPRCNIETMASLWSTSKHFHAMLKKLLPHRPAWQLFYSIGSNPLFYRLERSHAFMLLDRFPIQSPERFLVPFIARSCHEAAGRIVAGMVDLAPEYKLKLANIALQYYCNDTLLLFQQLAMTPELIHTALVKGLPNALSSSASDDCKLPLVQPEHASMLPIETIARALEVGAGRSGLPIIQALVENCDFSADALMLSHPLSIKLGLCQAASTGHYRTLEWMIELWYPTPDAVAQVVPRALETLAGQSHFKRKHLTCFIVLEGKVESEVLMSTRVQAAAKTSQGIIREYPVQVTGGPPA
eukprot:m.18964 g.18964  ORF g.18964 m.18964 type:complete len:319 (-) comp10871_c0_seq2:214-1170(-)